MRMQTQLFPDLQGDKKTRLSMLSDNCDAQEVMTFEKPLNEEELAVVKDEFSTDAVELNRLENELQAIKDEYKLKMKPVKESMGEKLGVLKTRQKTFTGNVYLFADQDASMMGYYDENGALVHSRRLRPEEKQTTVMAAIRTGTNG